MPLRTQLVEAGQTIKTDSFELLERNGPVSVRVQPLQDSFDDVVGLLLVLYIILEGRRGVDGKV